MEGVVELYDILRVHQVAVDDGDGLRNLGEGELGLGAAAVDGRRELIASGYGDDALKLPSCSTGLRTVPDRPSETLTSWLRLLKFGASTSN